MPEVTEEEFKKEAEETGKKTATEVYLKSLNPELWNKISSLARDQRDERWFNLTQSHLRDYQTGKIETEKFELEELEFLYLNQWNAKEIPTLDSEMRQRGFCFTPEEGRKKFHRFGDFIESLRREAEQNLEKTSQPFWILVGGIGISGKATLRNILTRELAEKCPQYKVISWDRDYQKIFPVPAEWQGNINIIEDVHGLDEARDENGKLKRFDGSEGLPEGYDMVVYVLPSAATFRQALTKRGIGWLQAGKLDLTAPEKRYPDDQKERIKQTAEELERFLPVAKEWFREQLRVLRELRKRGVMIAVVDPIEIFKKLYGFEEKPELSNQSFLTALERTLKSHR